MLNGLIRNDVAPRVRSSVRPAVFTIMKILEKKMFFWVVPEESFKDRYILKTTQVQNFHIFLLTLKV